MIRKMIGIPVSLAFVLTSVGCVEEIPKDQGKQAVSQARSQDQVEEVDHGPAPNAPKLDPDIVNPLVEDAPTGKYGGTLYLPAYEDPKTYNVTLVTDSVSARFLAYTFDALTDEDGISFDVTPSLAEKWEVAKDNRTYTFHLRKGVKWHDGHPFTADDVVFTWSTVLPNADIPWSAKDDLRVDGKLPVVTKVDDYTVKMQLPKPFAPFVRLTSGVLILPKHIWEPWMSKDKDGKLIALSKWGVDTDVSKVVGTGPWEFDTYAPGERITFKRNPHYFRVNKHKQPLPYLDHISIPFLKSLDTAILKFKAGETDSQWMPGKDYAYMKPMEHDGHFKIYNGGPDFRTTFVAFNLNPGTNKDGKPLVEPYKLKWFAEKRFRQAIGHAINRKAIIKAVYRGLAVPQDSPIFQKSPYFDPNVPKFEYDLDKAAKLLTEAGFVKKGSQLYDADGHPVKFSILSEVGFKEGEMEVNMIRQDLAKLGINMVPQMVTFNVKIARTHESKDWEAELGNWGAGVEPHGVNSLWKSNGVYHFFNLNPSDTPAKTWAYPWEKRIDELYDLGAMTLDEKKRHQIYNEFQHIVCDEQIMVFLPVYFYTVAIRDTVGNVRPSSFSTLGSSWNSYELYKK
jgi:peptide/nickel transport system substrate-binding protein